MYSKTVMDHFNNPRNAGVIEDADGIGEVGNPVCGDMMTFYIKVKDNRLEDVKFQTFGCVAAIAVSSMVSEIVKSKLGQRQSFGGRQVPDLRLRSRDRRVQHGERNGERPETGGGQKDYQ